MKTQLYLLTFLVIFGLNLDAQIGFGAKAGLNLNIITFSDSEIDPQSGIGFHLGGVASYRLNDNLYLGSELLFSSRKTSSTETEEDGGDTYESTDKATYNFLEIPLLAGWGKSSGLQIQAGPAFNLLLGGNYTSKETTIINGEKDTETRTLSGSDFKEDLTPLLFGAALGVGYKLESGLNFNVRFQRALNSLYDFGDDVDFSANWNTINLSVGYEF